MKRNHALVFLCLSMLTSCHHEDPAPADLLTKTWTVSAVSLDGVNHAVSFANMTVTFTSGNFTVLNAVPPVWLPSGTYVTKDQVITRNDGVAMQILEMSSTRLVLQFQYNAKALGGRVNQVSGIYKFEFVAN